MELISQESPGDQLAKQSNKDDRNRGLVNFKEAKILNPNTSSKLEENCVQKEIGHPDRVLQAAIQSSEESSDEDEDSEDESKDSEENEEDRDENFVIESDNIDEKLYSSETEDEDIDDLKNDETKVKKEKPYETAVKTSPKDLMSSTSSSEQRPKGQPSNPTRQIKQSTHATINDESNKDNRQKRILALNIQSDSETQVGAIDEFEVSGPENDLAEDDFWN